MFFFDQAGSENRGERERESERKTERERKRERAKEMERVKIEMLDEGMQKGPYQIMADQPVGAP